MDYDEYEQIIDEALKKYIRCKEQGKTSRDLYKKVNNQMDLYSMFLDENQGALQRQDWLAEKRKKLKHIKQQRAVANHEAAQQQINKEKKQIDDAMGRLLPNIQQAIKTSTYIRVQLQSQMQKLDSMYEKNKQGKERINRAKKGLQVILRNAMMNKCLRALVILTILSLLACIVIYIVL